MIPTMGVRKRANQEKEFTITAFSELLLKLYRLASEIPSETFQRHVLDAVPLNDMRLITIRRKSGPGQLSPREIEVAKMFGKGVKYREISEALYIAPTVRNHIRNIYDKLNISSKVELALLLNESEEE